MGKSSSTFGQPKKREPFDTGEVPRYGELAKKLCGIKLDIKYNVFNWPGDGYGGSEPGPDFFEDMANPVVPTKEGDEWGAKGQAVDSQELTLEILGCKVTSPSITVDTTDTTINQVAMAISNIHVIVTAWFECCSEGDGNCDTCCSLDNFTAPGGGHRHGLGGWRTGHFRDNRLVRTPRYSPWFSGNSPEEALEDLKRQIETLAYSDIISDLAKSYQNTSCD